MLSRLLINYEAQSRAFIDLISGGGPCAFFTCLFVNEQESNTGTNAAAPLGTNQPYRLSYYIHVFKHCHNNTTFSFYYCDHSCGFREIICVTDSRVEPADGEIMKSPRPAPPCRVSALNTRRQIDCGVAFHYAWVRPLNVPYSLKLFV